MIASRPGFQIGPPEGGTTIATGTEGYYRDRAHEYDRVYLKPERQADLRRIREWLPKQLGGRHVLELAAGTGYWTDVIADSELSVLATDFNVATLRVAEGRRIWPDTVTFVEADAFSLDLLTGTFDGALAVILLVARTHSTLDDFLEVLFGRLEPGAQVLFMDNRYVEGSNHRISRSDQQGNTFQTRSLDSGKVYEVLKTFRPPSSSGPSSSDSPPMSTWWNGSITGE